MAMRYCCTYLLFFISLVFSVPAFAEYTSIETVRTGIPHQAFFGVDFKGREGMVVGTAGSIMSSNDGGQTWQAVQQNQTQLSLFDVDIGASRTIIAGQMGTVLVKDPSSDWRLVDTGTEMRLLSVDQGRAGLIIAVGQFGTILRSTDGGDSWADVRPDWSAFEGLEFEPQLYDVHIDGQGLVTVVGEFGLVLRSGDEGKTWQILRLGDIPGSDYSTAPSLWALSLGKGDIGYSVGQEGLILKTTDGGKTWLKLQSNTTANLQDVFIDEEGRVFVIGIRELMWSSDGGLTWKRIQGADISTDWYQALGSGMSGDSVLAVGHAGRIIRIIQ